MAQTSDNSISAAPEIMAQRLILLLSTLAGVLLLIAERAIQNDWAGFQAPELRAACFAFAISLPFTFALLLGSEHKRRVLIISGAVVALLSILAASVATDYEPGLQLRTGPLFGSFSVSMLLAWFVAIPYLQGVCDSPVRLDYAHLFQRGWDNFLSLVTAHAFVLLCWLILWLSAALFNLLGLGFLAALLEEDVFYFPATGFMLGLGLMLGQAHLGAIRSILRICLSVSQTLLPAVAAITVLFSVALLLSDLTLLWATGHATFLLLSLVYLSIALVNGVYADGMATPTYARPVRLLVAAGLIVLPGLAILSLYAMGLRIGQYGLTIARLYGLVAIIFATAYSAAYAFSAIKGLRQQSAWLTGLGPTNRILGALLVLTLLVSQAPGIHFRHLSLSYQLATIDPTEQGPGRTDWSYLRFELGTPGYAAVQQQAQQAAAQGAQPLATHLEQVLAATHPHSVTSETFAIQQWLQQGKLEVLPAGTPVPEELAAAITASQDELPLFTANPVCNAEDQPCLLVSMDLKPGEEREWVLIPPPSRGCDYPLFVRTPGKEQWMLAGQMQPASYCIELATYTAIREGRWSTAMPEYQDLLTPTATDSIRWRFQPR